MPASCHLLRAIRFTRDQAVGMRSRISKRDRHALSTTRTRVENAEVKMRRRAVAAVTAQRDDLTLLDPFADFHERPVSREVPVHRLRAVVMPDADAVSFSG